MSNPGSIDNPVLPCENFDVEVVSDIIEDLDDIEVVAEPKDDPDPDIEVRAILPDDAGAANAAANPDDPNSPPPEPDYDVEVAAAVVDPPDPDIEVRVVIPASPAEGGNAAPPVEEPNSREDGPSAQAPPPEPDYDVEVTCKVIDDEEPDLALTCTITGNSNEPSGAPPNG